MVSAVQFVRGTLEPGSRIALVLAALVSALATVACSTSRSCTEAGCVNGVTLLLTAPSLPDGTYDLRLTSTNITARCQVVLAGGDTQTRDCPDGDRLDVQVVAGSTGPTGLRLNTRLTPAELAIDVAYETNDVLTLPLEPTYSQFSPNGPDCPPTCTAADGGTHSLTVD